MDVPAAAAGPWIALGAVLGILLLLATRVVADRLRSRAPDPPTAAAPAAAASHDDLAGFFDHPPGTPGAPAGDRDGWAPLGPAPHPAPREEDTAPAPAGPGSRPGAVLAALAVVALLLVGAAAALAASARSPEPVPATTSAPPGRTPSASPDPGAFAARLSFDGVVLEEHAVGVTAALPELELTVEDGRGVAHLRLPTVNCLATSAPGAPGDPGCRAGRTEYADLSSPELRVVRDGDEVTVSGRFPTYRRPPGAADEETGRSYEVTVTVAATGDGSGWVPAEGRLRWEDQRAATRTPSEVRSGG